MGRIGLNTPGSSSLEMALLFPVGLTLKHSHPEAPDAPFQLSRALHPHRARNLSRGIGSRRRSLDV